MTKPTAKKQTQDVLKKLATASSKALEDSRRSTVTRLLCSVLVKHGSATAAKRAQELIQKTFLDWNEVRISEKRQLISVLTDAGYRRAPECARDLLQILKDIYEQHNIANFDFDVLDKTLFAQPIPADPTEAPDTTTIREEGLPKHAEIPGFLDGERLVRDTSRLDGKLIDAKNGDAILATVFDNPSHTTARIVWAVALSEGLVQEGLTEAEAIPAMRDALGPDQIEFIRVALAYYETNSRNVDKFFKQQADLPDEDEEYVPFSVKIGFADAGAIQKTTEPIMPRSEGIGRLSKRADAKIAASPSGSGRRASAGSGRKAAVKSDDSAAKVAKGKKK